MRVCSPRRSDRLGSEPESLNLCSSRWVPSDAAENTTCCAVNVRFFLRNSRPVCLVLTAYPSPSSSGRTSRTWVNGWICAPACSAR
ncbi:Uncharacterised protein [Mycobacteroides abscessus subsp. abscessus]|nr:Uncharacterised protein [Mycobacteroides abscessus subsp. abscessus]